MKKIILAVALLFVLSGTGIMWAQNKSYDKSYPPSEGRGFLSDFVAMKAKVVSVDKKNRELTLEGEDGTQSTIKIDEKVKNFKKIKKGDHVKVLYEESIAWELKKTGKKEPLTKTTSSTVTTAKPGEKPAMTRIDQIDALTTITAIDRKKPTVTLKGPEGNSMTFKVRNPNNLKGVKVGDQVYVNYTESLVVSVEKED